MAVKRLVDIVFSLTGLVALAPVLLFTAFLVYLFMGRPVLFVQGRLGLDERVFKMVKFRTMSNLKNDGRVMPDADRLTRLGGWMRKFSIDELPQLWNVLKGEMSLIGPRPLLIEYREKYTERQRIRHTVRPGISGWAQVNGRQEAKFSKRLAMDVWYVENFSLSLDLKIFFLTIDRVFRSRGVISGQDVRDVDDLGFNEPISGSSSSEGDEKDGRLE